MVHKTAWGHESSLKVKLESLIHSLMYSIGPLMLLACQLKYVTFSDHFINTDFCHQQKEQGNLFSQHYLMTI